MATAIGKLFSQRVVIHGFIISRENTRFSRINAQRNALNLLTYPHVKVAAGGLANTTHAKSPGKSRGLFLDRRSEVGSAVGGNRTVVTQVGLEKSLK